MATVKEHPASTTDSSFTLSYAALQQQSLAFLKESQDYAVRAAELAMEHPLIRLARSAPRNDELVEGVFGVAAQAVELQRDFVSRLAKIAAK